MNKVELKNMPYAAVPFKILEDKDMSDSELRLYAIISFFASKEGYCYASNKYFGDMLGIKTRAVQTRLQKLVDKGYVLRSFTTNSIGEEERRLEINTAIFDNAN